MDKLEVSLHAFSLIYYSEQKYLNFDIIAWKSFTFSATKTVSSAYKRIKINMSPTEPFSSCDINSVINKDIEKEWREHTALSGTNRIKKFF